MEFANATYLWGLLGLLVPIAIHLWSRKKVVTIKIGSIKLLEASEPKQTSSVKLNEWWLLFLRMLTILLLVLIISEPSITKSQENVAVSYLIEPSLIHDDRMVTILDTLAEGSVRLLEKGFPEWDGTKVNMVKTPNYWQLAQEMHTIAADSIVVFSQGLYNGIHGRRPKIQANTKWILLEAENAIENSISAIREEGYVQVLSAESNSKALSFTKDSIPIASEDLEMNLNEDSLRLKSYPQEKWIALRKNKPIRIGIVYDDSLKLQKEYIKAAYSAISKFLDQPIELAVLKKLTTLSTINFNTIVSYSNVIPEDSKATLLIFRPDDLANDLIEKGPSRNIFYLNKLLNSENIVSESLPEKLLALLHRHEDLESAISILDKRSLAEAELQPVTSELERAKNIASVFRMTPWLWLALILVVLAERVLSKFRKQ